MISKVLKVQNSGDSVTQYFFNLLLVINVILFSYANRPRQAFTVILKVAEKEK